MKLYSIRKWAELFENNRSKTVKDLTWVAIPNRHDGEHFSAIMLHKNGAEIFSAWILLIQVASRCHPRGTLIRDGGKPHTAQTLSIKTRAPEKWFVAALEFLSKETDWLELQEVADDCQLAAIALPSSCQVGDEGGKEGKEGKGTQKPRLGLEEILSGLVFEPAFKAEDFQKTFSRWIELRMKGKKPKTEWVEFFQGQVGQLQSWGYESALYSLGLAIANQWDGLHQKFPPKQNVRRQGGFSADFTPVTVEGNF